MLMLHYDGDLARTILIRPNQWITKNRKKPTAVRFCIH